MILVLLILLKEINQLNINTKGKLVKKFILLDKASLNQNSR